MANKKSKYPKEIQTVHMERDLKNILRKLSSEVGCISHPEVGFSVSEVSRRLIKGAILKRMPYIKNSVKTIDWDEAI